MNWTVKTADKQISITSIDQLRDTIKSLPPGTPYKVLINDLMQLGGGISAKMMNAAIVQNSKLKNLKPLSMASSFSGVSPGTSTPRARRTKKR